MIRRDRRPGYALIECLILITVMGILSGLCGGMIHLLLRLDESSRRSAEQAADLFRLASDFRKDAHQSVSFEPPQGRGERIDLKLEGARSVEYAVRPLDILRTVREGDEVRRRETYRRPSKAAVRIEVSSEGPRRFASIVGEKAPGVSAGAVRIDFRIEALLGKYLFEVLRPE